MSVYESVVGSKKDVQERYLRAYQELLRQAENVIEYKNSRGLTRCEYHIPRVILGHINPKPKIALQYIKKKLVEQGFMVYTMPDPWNVVVIDWKHCSEKSGGSDNTHKNAEKKPGNKVSFDEFLN